MLLELNIIKILDKDGAGTITDRFDMIYKRDEFAELQHALEA